MELLLLADGLDLGALDAVGVEAAARVVDRRLHGRTIRTRPDSGASPTPRPLWSCAARAHVRPCRGPASTSPHSSRCCRTDEDLRRGPERAQLLRQLDALVVHGVPPPPPPPRLPAPPSAAAAPSPPSMGPARTSAAAATSKPGKSGRAAPVDARASGMVSSVAPSIGLAHAGAAAHAELVHAHLARLSRRSDDSESRAKRRRGPRGRPRRRRRRRARATRSRRWTRT